MTNPFTALNTPTQNPFTRLNTTSTPVEPESADGISAAFKSTINFTKNLIMVGASIEGYHSAPDPALMIKIGQGINNAPSRFKQAVSNIATQGVELAKTAADFNRFGAAAIVLHPQVASFVESMSKPDEVVSGVVRSLPALPAMFADMLINKPIEAALGVKLTEDSVRVLTSEEGTQAAQTTLGNIAAIAAYAPIKVAASAVVQRMAAKPIIEAAKAGASFGKIASTEARLSPLMRNIASEVVSDAAAGVIQGAVVGANQEDFYVQAITGLMFAPLGVVTGFLGVKPGLSEQLRFDAAKLAHIQMFKVSEDLTLKQIMARPEAIISAPTLARAVIDGDISIDKTGAGIISNIADKEIGATIQGLDKTNYSLYRNPKTRVNSILYFGEDFPLEQKKAAARSFENNGIVPKQTAFFAGQQWVIEGKTDEMFHRIIGTLQYGVDQPKYKLTSIDGKITKLVFGDEMRAANNQVRVINNEAFYEGQWTKFRTAMDPKQPFTQQVIDYAVQNDMPDKVVDFAREFGHRYNDLLDDFDDFSRKERDYMNKIMQEVATLDDSYKSMSEQVRTKAYSNNVWIEETNGGYSLRDVDSGNILGTVRTSAEALEFLDVMGQNVKKNQPLDLKVGEIRNIPQTATETLDRLQQPFDDVEKINAAASGNKWNKFTSRLGSFISTFDAASPRLTAMEGYLSAVDDLNGTNLRGEYYFETQRAARRAKAQAADIRNSPLYLAIENLATQVLKGVDGESRMELLTSYIESLDVNQLQTPNGIVNGYTLSPAAKTIAQKAITDGLDLRNIYRWRRQRLFIEDQARTKYQMKAHALAAQWLDQVRETPEYKGNPDKLALDQFKLIETETVKYLQDPKYISDVNALQGEFNVSSGGRVGDYQTFSEGLLSQLSSGKQGANDMYAASRYWDALRDPELALNRNQFKTKYKLTPLELKLAEMIEAMYSTLGNRFGVNADSRLVGYINHYRNWGDPLDPTFSHQLAAGISDAGTRRFVSTMLRTGETSNYIKNPLHAMDAYIRTGVKTELLRTLDDWSDRSADQVSKITASNPDVGKKVAERISIYEDALLGRPELDEKASRGLFGKLLEKMGYNEKEVAKRVEAGNTFVDTGVNLTSASLLGARPVMALRDVTDATIKFFSLHGKERTWDMLGEFLDKDKNWAETYKNLVGTGAIIDAEFKDVYNPTTTSRQTSAINQFSQKAADLAFKSSFQPQGFRRIQAAVYLESRKFSAKILRDLADNKIQKQEAYDKLFMNSWDKATVQQFDSMVSNGKFQEAVHFLSTNETQRIAGITGMGNAPEGAGTWMGRVFNQLGTWTIANRSVYGRMLTRGTATESRAVMRRYLTTQAALIATGAALGFNMSRWLMSPITFMFTGGPLIGAAATASTAGIALVGGDEQQRRYAFNQVKQSLLLPVPFGYAARGVYRGAQLGLNGQDYGFTRPAWAALGGSVSESRRSWTDMFFGSYPTPPEEGTNLNTALVRFLLQD